MDATDLGSDDLVMLLALARHLTNLDDLVSLPELTAFRELREHLGFAPFQAAVAASDRDFPTPEAALRGAGRISAEARPRIRALLHELAASDGVVDVEQAMLDALDAVWVAHPPEG